MNINELYAIVKRWEKGLISSDDLLAYIHDYNPNLSIKGLEEIDRHKTLFSQNDEVLTKLFKVAEWFFYIFRLKDLENLILWQLKEEYKQQFSQKKGKTVFSMIRCTYLLEPFIIENFHKLYDVSLNWTFSFFKLQDTADIDTIIDNVRSNTPELKRLFEKSSDLKNTIFFPYDFRRHVYFLIHYNDDKNATSVVEQGFSFKDFSLKTKKTFFFFFWENNETKMKFLVIRNSPYKRYDTIMIDCLSKILWSITDYDPYPISDFSLIEKSQNLPSPAKWETSINKIYLHKTGVSSLLSVSWKDSYKDTKNICSGTDMNIYGMDLSQKANNDTTKEQIGESLSGCVNKKNIGLSTDTQYIEYWLNLLMSNKLIQNKDSNYWFKTETEIIKQCFLDWEFMIKNKDDEISGIVPYIKKVVGIWEKKDENIKKENIDFHSKQFLTEEMDPEKISILNNVKVELNLEEYIKWKINKTVCCIELRKDRYCWVKITFPMSKYDLQKTIIFIARNFDDILSEVLKEKTDNKIVFLENIDEEVIKILLENNLCGDIRSMEELSLLFSSKKEFDKNIKIKNKRQDWLHEEVDVIQISESGNGGEFEDLVTELISPFLSNHMSFWKNYTWMAIPDWFFFWKKNNDSQILVLYDCKSSKDISDYLDSGEQRKFGSYINLFPDNNLENNVFVIFWPKIDDSVLQKIGERKELSELLEKGNKILYIWAEVLELLNKILVYSRWEIINACLKKNILLQVIYEGVHIGKLVKLEKNKLKEQIKRYGFEKNWMHDELYKNIDSKTDWTLVIPDEIDKFKDYLRNL